MTDDEIIDLAHQMLRPEDYELDVDSASILEFARELLRRHDAEKGAAS